MFMKMLFKLDEYFKKNKLLYYFLDGKIKEEGLLQKDFLKDNGIRQSISRKGNCYDNCVIEIFFETLEDLEKTMHEYISYYNNQRIVTKLNGLTPITYRHQSINNVIIKLILFSPTLRVYHISRFIYCIYY